MVGISDKYEIALKLALKPRPATHYKNAVNIYSDVCCFIFTMYFK